MIGKSILAPCLLMKSPNPFRLRFRPKRQKRTRRLRSEKPAAGELADLRRAVARLTTAHEELLRVTNHNARAFQEVLTALDVRLGAIGLVADDLVAGDVTLEPLAGARRVHWVAYERYYVQRLDSGRLITPDVESSDDVIVFGD